MDDEDGALLRRQPPERPLELIARCQDILDIPVAWDVGMVHIDLHDLAASRPLRQPIAGVDQQAIEPGVEPIWLSNGSDVQPCREERLLDRIRRIVVAAEDQPGGAMEPTNGARGEAREGVMISARCANDEVSLHRAPAFDTAGWPRSDIMSPRTM